MKPIAIRAAAETKTRELILDTAERLFAQRGLDKVSIRDITRAAGVNLGAVNYHFQTREKLIIEVFARVVTPLSRARSQALDAVEKACGEKAPTVAEVLGAFIRPAVEMAMKEGSRVAARQLLLGRSIAEAEPCLQEWMRQEMEPLIQRFDGAIQRALPRLAKEDIFWRMSFTFGAVNHLLIIAAKPLPGWIKVKSNLPHQMEHLIAFAAAGMSLPGLGRKF